MKTYNKPIITIENINIEDVILASFNKVEANEVTMNWDFGEKNFTF